MEVFKVKWKVIIKKTASIKLKNSDFKIIQIKLIIVIF